MATCVVCGNDYSKAFTITMNNQSYTFDCFECAINKLAPICAHCGCKIIGHGSESTEQYYCCAHCARREGVEAIRDHA